MNSGFFAKARKYVPLPVMVIAALTAVCGVLQVSFGFSERFSDFFNESVSSPIRAFMAALTSWIPFSFAEALVILLPFIAVYAIVAYICRKDNSWSFAIRFMLCTLAVLMVIYILFVVMFASGYRGSTLDKKMSLDKTAVSTDELYDTMKTVVAELNLLAGKVGYSSDGSSKMPYSLNELNDKIVEAYDAVREDYPFISNFKSRFKPVVLSPLMTYMHISGVYSYFTGESNVNTNYPDYVIAYTAAHELAHQRGIARENEANFVAYLVCISSDDDYLRYSGYLNMYEYLASAMRKASKEKYKEIYSSLEPDVRGDLIAYSKFFEKYRNSVASAVSGAVNDAYLKVQGTEGTRSYGLVVDLAVAYHKKER